MNEPSKNDITEEEAGNVRKESHHLQEKRPSPVAENKSRSQRSRAQRSSLKGVRSGHYLQDSVMAGGCGAKLDPRDFGPKGKIDHDIYYIKVNETDEEKAKEILRENGLTAGIAEDLMVDAALRKHNSPI